MPCPPSRSSPLLAIYLSWVSYRDRTRSKRHRNDAGERYTLVMPSPLYLDNNATTPILPEVADAMHTALLAYGGNASSQHAAGRAARRTLEDCRERIAKLLGAKTGGMDADRLIFTSGGTESNNWALRGAVGRAAPAGGGSLITSSIEHPSIAAPADQLAAEGHTLHRLPVDANGVTQVDALDKYLEQPVNLISVMLGNSETGVLQPVDNLSTIAAEHGVPMHTDATQVVGKLPVDFQSLGVATMTFSAHKFHGPVGIGGLLVRNDCQLTPLMQGSPGAERPGTATVALAVGMARALDLAHREMAERRQRITQLRDQLEQHLVTNVPGATIVGAGAGRLPHTTNIAFEGLDRQALAMALDRVGVECSTGSACASGSSEPSPVLMAMGLPVEQIRGAIRLSLGALTTAAEVEDAALRISNVCLHLRQRKTS